MQLKDKLLAQRIYLLLGGLFITSLVVSNLIFQKFFYWYPIDIEIFGSKLFEISVGILPYPITFLITDLISEIYINGRKNLLRRCFNNIIDNAIKYGSKVDISLSKKGFVKTNSKSSESLLATILVSISVVIVVAKAL